MSKHLRMNVSLELKLIFVTIEIVCVCCFLKFCFRIDLNRSLRCLVRVEECLLVLGSYPYDANTSLKTISTFVCTIEHNT